MTTARRKLARAAFAGLLAIAAVAAFIAGTMLTAYSCAAEVNQPTADEAFALMLSGPVISTHRGQIIERLDIVARSGTALTITHPDVVVRNVRIAHAGGHGIEATDADRLRIENVEIVYTAAPERGANADLHNNIVIDNAPDASVSHVRLVRGSSGIWVHRSPRTRIAHVEGHDFRGPYPRGQLAQFDKSDDCRLEDFSVESPAETSFPEDNVSVFHSSGCELRRGRIHGNNSAYGIGVMFELEGASDGLAEDIDVTGAANGCFSVVDGTGVTFRRVGCRDTVCVTRDGIAPSSDSLAIASWGSDRRLHTRLENSRYSNLCNQANRVWDEANFDRIEFRHENFVPRPFIRLEFPWEPAPRRAEH